MIEMLIFGHGYTGARIAAAVHAMGGQVQSTGRDGSIAFNDAGSVRIAIAQATHIVATVPPMADGDPVLATYGDAIRARGAWLGYLSSTGVYGDSGGAWVDEAAPVGGRRENRNEADKAWQALGARVFRLPGIYGLGRSALERVAEGKAHRIDLPDQVFSRVHVDDIVSGVIAGFDAPQGVYNLADDRPCSQNAVIEYACDLLGLSWPEMQGLEAARLSPQALAFYAENRRVSNAKAKRALGWRPAYPDFAAGLRAVRAINSPTSASAQPAAAIAVQR